jgi:hypothetical protein
MLRNALEEAQGKAFGVYERTRLLANAKRSGAFASGRYEGLNEALRILGMLGDLQSEPKNPAAPSPRIVAALSRPHLPRFATVFQKNRSLHGSALLGRW